MRYTFYIRVRARAIPASFVFLRFPEARADELRGHPLAYAQERRLNHRLARDENHVHAALDVGDQRGHRFAHTSFDAVSNHRIADFLTDRKANSDFLDTVFCIDQREQPARAGFARPIGIAKLFLSPERITVLHNAASF